MLSILSQDKRPFRGHVCDSAFSQDLYPVSKAPLGGNIAQSELDSNPASLLN